MPSRASPKKRKTPSPKKRSSPKKPKIRNPKCNKKEFNKDEAECNKQTGCQYNTSTKRCGQAKKSPVRRKTPKKSPKKSPKRSKSPKIRGAKGIEKCAATISRGLKIDPPLTGTELTSAVGLYRNMKDVTEADGVKINPETMLMDDGPGGPNPLKRLEPMSRDQLMAQPVHKLRRACILRGLKKDLQDLTIKLSKFAEQNFTEDELDGFEREGVVDILYNSFHPGSSKTKGW